MEIMRITHGRHDSESFANTQETEEIVESRSKNVLKSNYGVNSTGNKLAVLGIVSYWLRAVTLVLFLIIPLANFTIIFRKVWEVIYLLMGRSDSDAAEASKNMRSAVAEQIAYISENYCPGEIILYGDYDILKGSETYVVFSNHQIYTDWLTIWNLSRYWGAAGGIVIILKKSLLKLPLIGQMISSLGFIGISRDWSRDEHTLKDSISNLSKLQHPIWLLMFPEGTVITAETYALSTEYAKCNNIPWRFEYVLLPKSRGISACIDSLSPKIKGLVDLTITYSGIPPKTYPYDYYSIPGMFFGARYPKRIHVRVKYYPISSVPGKSGNTTSLQENSDKIFADWLKDVFLDKDRVIRNFHKTGRFDGQSKVISPAHSIRQSIRILLLWVSIIFLHLVLLLLLLLPFL